ncbi:MAG: DUF3179 domain-containing protein [Haloferacaceae archaeon]
MRNLHTRRAVVAGLAALAGCAGGASSVRRHDASNGASTAAPTASADAPTGTTADGGAPPPVAAHALPIPESSASLRHQVVDGGPPKDGIPSVDDPTFVPAADAAFLAADDVVFGVARGDDVKAYPQRVLVHHEICNDVLDGTPVSVTYCPLTGTAMGFERGDTTFGVSGKLLNSNLVMYDRATDSRWPQMLARAIDGPLAGETLREFRLVWTTWAQWRERHPETVVLSTDTGYVRNYADDPYGSYTPRRGYYARDGTLFPPLAGDDRRPSKAVVLGGRTPDGAVAFDVDALGERGVVTGELGSDSVVAVHDDVLDTGYVYWRGDATVAATADGVRVDGQSYRPAELPLDPLYAFDAMWFAWAGFYPETALYA